MANVVAAMVPKSVPLKTVFFSPQTVWADTPSSRS